MIGLLIALAGCSAGEAPLAVRGRLAGAEPRATLPPLLVEPRGVGSEIREAPRLAADSRFDVAVEPGDAALSFATAVAGAEACRRPLRFRIEARSGESWQPLFEAEQATTPQRWQERRIDLGAAGARWLRFTTRVPEGAGCGSAEPLWGSVLFLGEPEPERRELPNVLLISLDTLGASYLGRFGGLPGVSPNLDAFLAEGFSFDRALAQYGVTRTSHASLFSGLYPLRHGAYPFSPVRPLASLVPLLATRGYHTLAFTEGGLVSGVLGFQRGFDRYDDSPAPVRNPAYFADAAETFRRALDWLAANGRHTRFFLFLHTYEVHVPYRLRDTASRELMARLRPDGPPGVPALIQARWILHHNDGTERLSDDELAHLRALYSAEIHYLDTWIGRLLDRLDALGLARRTLVVLTADHGDQFGEQGKVGHGESLSNRVLHVPLGFRWPGVIEAGSDAAPAQLVDVMPTILELLGVAAPERDGRSLVPRLHGADGPERPAFAELRSARGECRRLGRDAHCRLDRYAVQTARFKLVRSGLPPGEFLYDLSRDPDETRDVAETHPETRAHLRELLDTYLAAAEPGADDASGGLEVEAPLRERLRALGYLE